MCLLEHGNNSSLYNIVRSYLFQNYAVIYAAQTDPISVLSAMNRCGIEAENYIERGCLKIIDRDMVYSPEKTKLDSEILIDVWSSLVHKVSKSPDIMGILTIGSAENFIETGNHSKLIQYEREISNRFNLPVETVCCYNIDSLSSLPYRYAIPILCTHKYTIHNRNGYYTVGPDKIMNTISEALDSILGKGTAELIFKTLNLIYKLDKETAITRPELFEQKVTKLLGSSAEMVLEEIIRTLKNKMSFNGYGSTDQ